MERANANKVARILSCAAIADEAVAEATTSSSSLTSIGLAGAAGFKLCSAVAGGLAGGGSTGGGSGGGATISSGIIAAGGGSTRGDSGGGANTATADGSTGAGRDGPEGSATADGTTGAGGGSTRGGGGGFEATQRPCFEATSTSWRCNGGTIQKPYFEAVHLAPQELSPQR